MQKVAFPKLPVVIAAVTLAAIAPSDASAQVSVDLSYHGRLEVDAVPSNDSVTLRLGVFDDGADASCLAAATLSPTCGNFSQTVVDVAVAAGEFSTGLTAVPPDALLGNVSLGVAVETPSGAFIMLGLQPIRSVPKAAQVIDTTFAPPVGSIIAWHPAALGQTIADLPENWVPCSGQTVGGIVVPNLNGTGRFLRGSNVSGTLQDDALQVHTHVDSGHNHTFLRPRHFAAESLNGNSMYTTSGDSANAYTSTTNAGAANLGAPTVFGGGGTPRTATETRPTNMSVVWIMRVR